MAQNLISAATAIVVLLLGWLYASLKAGADKRAGQLKEIMDWTRAADIKFAELGVKVSPFWKAIQDKISADLHHPNPKYADMDELLTKLDAMTLTAEERVKLKEMLVQRSHDITVTAEERASAAIMGQVMDKVLHEAAAISKQEGEAVATEPPVEPA